MRTIKNFGVITVISISLLLIPSTTFASWWNPTTWFTKKVEVQKVTPAKIEIKNEKAPPTTEAKEIKQDATTAQKSNTTPEIKKTPKITKIVNANKVLNETNNPIATEKNVTKEITTTLETAKFTELENLKKEWQESRVAGTGYYSVPKDENVDFSTIMAVRAMADKYYLNKIQILNDEYLRIKYANNPAMLQQIINNSESRNISNNISNRIDELNNRLDSINSKQGEMKKCLNDLTDGLPGNGCN